MLISNMILGLNIDTKVQEKLIEIVMIGWNSCPANLKEDLNLLMCSDIKAINTFRNWLTQPGLDRPTELNYYEDVQLLKLLINLLQDDQAFCGQQA